MMHSLLYKKKKTTRIRMRRNFLVDGSFFKKYFFRLFYKVRSAFFINLFYLVKPFKVLQRNIKFISLYFHFCFIIFFSIFRRFSRFIFFELRNKVMLFVKSFLYVAYSFFVSNLRWVFFYYYFYFGFLYVSKLRVRNFIFYRMLK